MGEGGHNQKRRVVKGGGRRTGRLAVYFGACLDVHEAINREKQIKGGSRMKKIDLINSMNPEWKNLSVELDMF